MKYLGNSSYQLSSGKEIYANRGILGVSSAEPKSLFEGYDGTMELGWQRVGRGEPVFTPEERDEIAGFMIRLWKEWAK